VTTAERDLRTPTSRLIDLARPMLYVLWLPLCVVLCGLFIYSVARRVGYPYPLEWLEPASADLASRILHGLPLYCEPTYRFVPSMKTPLYYYAVAGVSLLCGPGLLAGRLVSLVSAAGTCLVIGRFIRREGGSWAWTILGVALFLGTFRIARQWYDIARQDTLFLALLMAGTYALRFWRGQLGAAGAGALFAAAFFTKQTLLLVAVPTLAAMAVMQARRAAVAFAALAILAVAGVVVLHVASDGWSTFFLVVEPRYGGVNEGAILPVWSEDLLPPFGLALAAALVFLALRWRSDRPAALLYAGLLFGAVMSGWIGRVHPGGTANALLPIFAAVAVAMPLGLQACLGFGVGRESVRRLAPFAVHAVAAIQLALLLYDPSAIIPDARDRQAGDEVLGFLRRVDGDVLVMDDRFFATLAGKPTKGLDFSVTDLLRVRDSTVPRDFEQSVIGALQNPSFSGVVDPPEFVIRNVRLAPPVPIQSPPSHSREEDLFRPHPERYYAILR
jgi:hypothetical protein